MIRHFVGLIGIISILAATPAAQGAELTKVVPVSYSFENPTLDSKAHSDPGFTKLTDGGSNTSASVVWRVRDARKAPLDLRFKFAAPFHLREVHVTSLYRRAYGISTIQLFVGEGANEQAIAEIKPMQPYEPPKDFTPRQVFSIPADAGDVTSVRVRITGVSYIGLYQVEFFGERPAPVATAPAASASVFTLPPSDPAQPFRLLESDFNGDGHADILLENDVAAYIIDPRWGGVVNYAWDKRGRFNLVKPHTQGIYGGIFADHVWPGPYRSGPWHDEAYAHEVISRDGDRLQVRLSRRGSGALLAGVTFEKTYTLERGSAALRADYRVHNDQENVIPVDSGVWIHNGMGSETTSWRVFWPTPTGVQTAGQGKGATWSHEPTRNWLGMVTQEGNGLALLQDYPLLECHYTERQEQYSTIEWRLVRQPIEAGNYLETTAWAVPFYGLKEVHGVSPAMAGGIEVQERYAPDAAPKTVAFTVAPAVAGEYVFVAEARRLPDKEWTRLSEQQRTLAHEVARFEAPLPAMRDGTWVVRVNILAHGQPVMDMERVFHIGAPSGDYVMEAPMPRLASKGAGRKALDVNYRSMEYVSAHVNWARPYAGGRPRVLFLPQKRPGIREAIELAQRFDMEPHTNYMTKDLKSGLWDLADYAGHLNADELMPHLGKMLKAERFDAIVIPGNLWKFMTPWIREEIVRRVEQDGMGLVLLAPEELPPALEPLMKGPSKPVRFTGRWTSARSHFITEGIPFAALPPSEALPYETSGEVLATISGKPLIIAAEKGKGRVVAASWVVAGRKQTGYEATYGGVGLTPTLLQLGVDATHPHHYWEYHLSALARMVYWAAQREPKLTGEIAATAENGALNVGLVLRNADAAPVSVSVTATSRDRFYREENTRTWTHELQPGENRLALTLPHTPLEGLRLVDIVVKQGDATAWWGTASLQIAAPARIASVSTGKAVWQTSEVLEGVVKITGKVPPGARLSLAATDNWDRLFHQQELDAAATVRFRIPLADCLGLRATITATLKAGEASLSEERAAFSLYGAPDPTRFQVAFGWPFCSVEGVRAFMMKDYYRRLKELGATAIWTANISDFEWEQARSLNLPTSMTRAGLSAGGKRPNTVDESKGKFGLIRNPCLSEPGFQARLEESQTRIFSYEDAGSLCRSYGDEVNSVGVWDGCYSPHCQEAFREWLKEQYGTLDALNREWDTNFREWKDVIAMTQDEVRGRSSFAPWADHRTFNEWNWARSFEAIRRGTEKANPAMRISISGTQETSPFNAYDWRRLMRSLNALASYIGEQSIMQRSFSPDFLWMPWIGYAGLDADTEGRVLGYLLEGATGFNIYSGRYYLNPDFSFSSTALKLRAVLGRLKQGRAEAIMRAKIETSPIAFHYSPASIHVNWMLDQTGTRKSVIEGLRAALDQVGCSYDYLAYDQLAGGEAAAKGYRLLVLPTSTALSPAEAEGVRQFVRDGGVVLADLLPGGYSDHGKRQEHPVLDDVFGVRHSGAAIRQEEGILKGTLSAEGIDAEGLAVPVQRFSPGLTLEGGRALAHVAVKGRREPALIVHRYGRGMAVLVGCDLYGVYGSWGEMRMIPQRADASRGVEQLTRSILKAAAVPERFIPLVEDGTRLKAVRMQVRRNGGALVLGLVRDAAAAKNVDPRAHQVSIQLPQALHQYNLLDGAYLGRSDQVKSAVTPTTHLVFTLLPYHATGVKAQLGATEVPRGGRVEVAFSVVSDGEITAEHTLFVRFLGPDGAERPACEELLRAPGGVAQLSRPIALNDAPGRWKVEVRDALTGAQGAAEFLVQ